MVTDGKPYAHWLAANHIWETGFGIPTAAFVVALEPDELISTRLFDALQKTPYQTRLRAAHDWEATINSLRDWHTTNAPFYAAAFVMNAQAFFGLMLAHDLPMLEMIMQRLRATVRAVYPEQETLPLLRAATTPPMPSGNYDPNHPGNGNSGRR